MPNYRIDSNLVWEYDRIEELGYKVQQCVIEFLESFHGLDAQCIYRIAHHAKSCTVVLTRQCIDDDEL